MRGIKFTLACLLVFYFSAAAQTTNVTLINIEGPINPASSEYIASGIDIASKNNSECLILELNTPGGLLASTREIVTNILQSPIPIVVYVYPSGARAASAGVFITLAANIAVMAPGTNIGAAHPVTLQRQQDSIMMEKATNDAAAFIRSISTKRNRNIKWAEDAVRKSLSLTESEALKNDVIDFIAKDENELLRIINNQECETSKGKVFISTTDARIIRKEMTFKLRILNIISDPNIAYILFMLGIYGLLFELYNPGAIFPGVIGGICLILAFYSLHTLPVNYAGLALIIFAIILFVLEIKIVSHGILSIGGVISLVLGSIMLIDVESALEFAEISIEVIILITALTVIFFSFAIGLGIKAQRKKPTTGVEGMTGETGISLTKLNPNGKIKVHGEIWDAESSEGEIGKNSKVVVLSINELTLKVKKLN